jgi:hypothetical protein
MRFAAINQRLLHANTSSNKVVPKIAVLIDGDNAESSLVGQFIAEAGKFGKVTVKRVYADFTSLQNCTWKEPTNNHALRPMQKFAFTSGKNSTYTALIIDAMDLLHSQKVDGFCIVSSDSDYTGLAQRIREEGFFVMGIGRKHTPVAFIRACEIFTYSEGLPTSSSNGNGKRTEVALASDCETSVRKIDFDMVRKAFQSSVHAYDGKLPFSILSQALRILDPTFHDHYFGFPSFRAFCEALHPHYDVICDKDGDNYHYFIVECKRS